MIKIKKTKITWVIEENRIVAVDKLQATSYSLVNNPKKNLRMLKRELLEGDMGNNWVEVLELAQKHQLMGVAVRKEKGWLDEFDGLL